MRSEICKTHNIDHTGTHCGSCVVRWKTNAEKLKKARHAMKLIERWVRVDTMPKDHPLRHMKRALK